MADNEAVIILTEDEELEESFDYDELWKDFIASFWREILERFMPDLYAEVDLNHEPEFLDKELHEITSALDGEDKKSRKRYVDELIKIFLTDGRNEWVLLHIEIQGRGGEDISLRMFRYYCLIFIHHDRNPAALAILTAKRPRREGEPGTYKAEVFGTSIEYKYNLVKAYALDDEELKAGSSPVDLFIYSVKVAAKYRKSNENKFKYMREIIRLLAAKGWAVRQRDMFVMFLERVMRFSNKEYRLEFDKEVKSTLHEGGTNMRYKGLLEESLEYAIEKGIIKSFAEASEKDIAFDLMHAYVEILENRRETSCNLIKQGILTDEQIAEVTNQTLKDIKDLRKELNEANNKKGGTNS